VERITAAGGEVVRDAPDGGPKGGALRTLPLGLANARSLGDAPNPHVLPLPEVLRVRGSKVATLVQQCR